MGRNNAAFSAYLQLFTPPFFRGLRQYMPFVNGENRGVYPGTVFTSERLKSHGRDNERERNLNI